MDLNTIIAIGSVLLLVCILISMGIGRIMGSVNPFQENGDAVMSRSGDAALQESPSSQRQTALQTDSPSDRQPISRDVMLDIYRLLREHNVSRERARPVLKAAGIPLDNNLWTAALEEGAIVTPIAGRVTRANFADPDLDYQPPPK